MKGTPGFLSICAILSSTAAALQSGLADFALQKTLQDASPVFGHYRASKSHTSKWMRAYPDDTPITHMNIPGTHDAATWNYSRATQQYLEHITDLVGGIEVDPSLYRCQTRSLFDMLDDGIRAFDLRYAFDVTNSTLVFWHGPALQSETATVDDILFGFYKWLDDHPSEAVFLSFQYQSGTAPYAQNDAGVQKLLHAALTSQAAQKYILQTKDTIGTLGQTRGKITLLRRFDLNKLDSSYTASLPGLHFSPKDWTDNSPDLKLVYNKETGEAAYIEDYYEPHTATDSSLEENVAVKLNATVAYLEKAANSHRDSLFWSFASSNNIGHAPPITPEMQALGNGTSSTATLGVNQRLLQVLKKFRGKRLGIVMFDFYETSQDLIPTFLSLLPPKCTTKPVSIQ